jgi:hypothetical protein
LVDFPIIQDNLRGGALFITGLFAVQNAYAFISFNPSIF